MKIKNVFVFIEGVDGVGKTTYFNRCKKLYNETLAMGNFKRQFIFHDTDSMWTKEEKEEAKTLENKTPEERYEFFDRTWSQKIYNLQETYLEKIKELLKKTAACKKPEEFSQIMIQNPVHIFDRSPISNIIYNTDIDSRYESTWDQRMYDFLDKFWAYEVNLILADNDEEWNTVMKRKKEKGKLGFYEVDDIEVYKTRQERYKKLVGYLRATGKIKQVHESNMKDYERDKLLLSQKVHSGVTIFNYHAEDIPSPELSKMMDQLDNSWEYGWMPGLEEVMLYGKRYCYSKKPKLKGNHNDRLL